MQQKIWQLSHRTLQGIQRELVRKSGSGSRSVGRGREEMTGYPAVRNHTKLRGSTKSRKERVRPRAGKDREVDDHRLLKRRSYLPRRATADYSCVWTTKPSIKPSPTDAGDARQDLSNAYHLIRIKEGDEYKKPRFAPGTGSSSPLVMPFGLTNVPATTTIRTEG